MAERSEMDDAGQARAPDGWAAHDAEQQRAWLRTTHRQRLEWLEEAKRFAALAAEAARSRSHPK